MSAAPPRVYVTAMLGFHPREYDAEATWRWMGQTGALRIVVAGESAEIVLELEMKAFPRERRVGWLVDGRPRGRTGGGAWLAPLRPSARDAGPGKTTRHPGLSGACRGRSTTCSSNGDPVPWAWRWGGGESSHECAELTSIAVRRTRRLVSPMLHEFLTLHRDRDHRAHPRKGRDRGRPRGPRTRSWSTGCRSSSTSWRRRCGVSRRPRRARPARTWRAAPPGTAASCGGPVSPWPRSSTTTGTSARR